MQNSIILRVFLLGAFAIIGIIALQSYWVISTWNINQEEFDQKVNLALYDVAKDLAKMNNSELPARDVIKRKTTNYYIVNIANEFDAQDLEHFLHEEFQKRALQIDFEYAVFDCTTNAMLYGNYCSYDPNGKKDVKLGHLPKDTEFTYYFGIKFPNRSSYLFDKMQLSAIFSVILFVTILFFAYSMLVILRQKRLSEMQKDFINNMTHEFKTPISTMRIAADVFLTAPAVKADNRLFQYAGIIKDQNQRLNDQVEKMLQLTRIEKHRLELKKEALDLEETLCEIIVGASVQVEKQQGRIEYECKAKGVEVLADRLHLVNVLHNLLDNAVKYCTQTPDIKILLKQEGKFVRLSIADNGIGISKEHARRVFDKFYRVPTGNVHNVKGFGLGLFYVWSVCKAHRWKIELDSEPGKGTTISLLMPIYKKG
ncbi:MAG: HAMP domain-containing histidine kinase [Saprospiraceae bacterium]|nr:HAMP domain-containing histidine kinase [Saprospiraceae bacterium]